MRGLIILCLTSLAIAAPQGYNYAGSSHQPHQHYGSAAGAFLRDTQATTTSTAGTEPNFALTQNQPQPQAQAQALRYLAPAATVPNVPIYEAPIPTVANLAFNSNQHQQQNYEQPQAETIISKRFFIHSAPEDEEEQREDKIITVGKARKNYNVVFIKSPSKSAQRASIKITPAVNEEKTVIYVLAKNNDGSEIDAQVQEAVTTTAKPEVYFIKYKTAEEAAHAQQTIQAQYDSLGGSTQITNEGTAAVSSVIGVLDAAKQAATAADAVQVAQPELENQMQYVHNAGNVGSQQQQLVQVQQPEQEVVTSIQQVQSVSRDATNNGYLPPSHYYY